MPCSESQAIRGRQMGHDGWSWRMDANPGFLRLPPWWTAVQGTPLFGRMRRRVPVKPTLLAASVSRPLRCCCPLEGKGDTPMQEAPPLLFNPLDPAFRIDPYPVYARLRDEAPVYPAPFGGWVLSRYADCVAVLKDPHASSDFRNSAAFKPFVAEQGIAPNETVLGGARPFLFLDPPDHTRLRGLVNKAFTPKVVEGLRPRIQQIVDDLLDSVAEQGSMEVIEDFAYPLPVTVICEMLGVPAADHETFKEWSRELARSLDPEELLPQEVVERRH